MAQYTILIAIALALSAYLVSFRFFAIKLDSREPPVAPHTIPYISHVIGLMRQKFNYYVELRY